MNHDKRQFRFFLFFLALWLVLLTAIPSIFYTVLPLDTVETVMWSHPLSMGNAKHPPLAAWLAGLFTLVFAHTDFALYLLSQVMLVIGFVYMYRLSREFFGVAKSVFAVILLAFVVFYSFDSAKFNVNLPHMALWPMTVFYFYRGIRRDWISDWVLFGLSAALSVLSKFFGLELIFSLFLFVLSSRATRKYFKRPGPYLAAGVFFLTLTPYLIWLVRNGFPPFTYLSERVSDHEVLPFWYPAQVLGESLYPLALPLAALLVTMDHPVQALRRIRFRLPRPVNAEAARLALFVQFTPIAVFVILAVCGSKIDLMWTYPIFFITGFLLMAFWKDDVSPREFKKLAVLTVSAFVLVQALDIVYWMRDTRLRGHFDGHEFAAAADKFYRGETGREIPLVFGEMWYAGCVMQYLPYHPFAGSFEDPYDAVRFRSVLEERGALGVFLQPKDADLFLSVIGVDVKALHPKLFTFFYSAPYGERENRPLYLVVIPPKNAAAH